MLQELEKVEPAHELQEYTEARLDAARDRWDDGLVAKSKALKKLLGDSFVEEDPKKETKEGSARASETPDQAHADGSSGDTDAKETTLESVSAPADKVCPGREGVDMETTDSGQANTDSAGTSTSGAGANEELAVEINPGDNVDAEAGSNVVDSAGGGSAEAGESQTSPKLSLDMETEAFDVENTLPASSEPVMETIGQMVTFGDPRSSHLAMEITACDNVHAEAESDVDSTGGGDTDSGESHANAAELAVEMEETEDASVANDEPVVERATKFVTIYGPGEVVGGAVNDEASRTNQLEEENSVPSHGHFAPSDDMMLIASPKRSLDDTESQSLQGRHLESMFAGQSDFELGGVCYDV